MGAACSARICGFVCFTATHLTCHAIRVRWRAGEAKARHAHVVTRPLVRSGIPLRWRHMLRCVGPRGMPDRRPVRAFRRIGNTHTQYGPGSGKPSVALCLRRQADASCCRHIRGTKRGRTRRPPSRGLTARTNSLRRVAPATWHSSTSIAWVQPSRSRPAREQRTELRLCDLVRHLRRILHYAASSHCDALCLAGLSTILHRSLLEDGQVGVADTPTQVASRPTSCPGRGLPWTMSCPREAAVVQL